MCSYKNNMLQLAFGVVLCLSQGLSHASVYVDVLDLPAKVSPLAVTSPLSGMARAGDRLVAVGQRGHILYSDDVGKHWQQAAVPVSADLNAVSFPSATQGWAVGGDGVILHSDDAGATWRKQLDGRQIGALLVEHYQALASAEPGNEQWPLLVAEGERLVAQGADKPLLDVWFANDRLGYVVGVFNLILRTEDGGQSWTPFQDRTDNPQGFHLNAIASTGDALYIAGEQGLLLKWDDAGQRFAAVQTPIKAVSSAWSASRGKRSSTACAAMCCAAPMAVSAGPRWTPACISASPPASSMPGVTTACSPRADRCW